MEEQNIDLNEETTGFVTNLIETLKKKEQAIWLWAGAMVVVIIFITLIANSKFWEKKLQTEITERLNAVNTAIAPNSQLQNQQGVSPQSNPAVLEMTYNKIADIMNKITVSIYSNTGNAQPQLLGSGIIISNQDILTNFHIIKNRNNLFISISSPSAATYPVALNRFDSNNDLAILSILNNINLYNFGQIGNSDTVAVGDMVFAMGNAFGNGNFFSSGMIIDKSFSYGANGVTYNSMFRTSLNIYPGTCGGPLVNFKGEIIGINTSAGYANNNYLGIGYATPINRIADLMNNTIQNQNPQTTQIIGNTLPNTINNTPIDNTQNNPYSLA